LKIRLTKDLEVLTKAGMDPGIIEELIRKAKETEQLDTEYHLYKQEYRYATISLSKFKNECKRTRTA
jgi:hypothetical protein